MGEGRRWWFRGINGDVKARQDCPGGNDIRVVKMPR